MGLALFTGLADSTPRPRQMADGVDAGASGDKATPRIRPPPGMGTFNSSSPLARSQTRMISSKAPVTTESPSDETSSDSTLLYAWWFSSRVTVRWLTSQTRTTPSAPPETSVLPSGVKSMHSTGPWWAAARRAVRKWREPIAG